MQKIVGVKRKNDRDIYYFTQPFELNLGDKVVVDFDEFETVAEVVKIGLSDSEDKTSELKQVKRKATNSDISKYQTLQEKAKSKLPEIKSKSLALGLMMKFISAEISLDESKVLIVFSSEDRVDFRQLLRELASMFHARIELKQIGQRDEVKICGGVGPCGQPCCCARFLKSFDHVTVKMAKVQGLSLSPTKINGVCGRLMCCLGYESKMYEDMLEKMPKIGNVIKTPNGLATVVYNDILRERVALKRQSGDESFVVEDYSLEEIENFKKGIFNAKPNEEKQGDELENNSENSNQNKNFKVNNKQDNGFVQENHKIQGKENGKEIHKSQENIRETFGDKENGKVQDKFAKKSEKNQKHFEKQNSNKNEHKENSQNGSKYGISFEDNSPEIIVSSTQNSEKNSANLNKMGEEKTETGEFKKPNRHKNFRNKKHENQNWA